MTAAYRTANHLPLDDWRAEVSKVNLDMFKR